MKLRKGFVENGIGFIPLTQGLLSKVDPEMVPILEKRNWRAYWNKSSQAYYAQTTIYVNGKSRTILLHRFILGLDFGNKLQADHIDRRNTLDNRRINLRSATSSQNALNSLHDKVNTSGVKGVDFHQGSWRVRVRYNGKRIDFGSFKSFSEAKEVAIYETSRLHGEFARCV